MGLLTTYGTVLCLQFLISCTAFKGDLLVFLTCVLENFYSYNCLECQRKSSALGFGLILSVKTICNRYHLSIEGLFKGGICRSRLIYKRKVIQ